ncbi:hypothetical protein ABPG72_009907 [Tetrahymena utriculariae]
MAIYLNFKQRFCFPSLACKIYFQSNTFTLKKSQLKKANSQQSTFNYSFLIILIPSKLINTPGLGYKLECLQNLFEFLFVYLFISFLFFFSLYFNILRFQTNSSNKMLASQYLTQIQAITKRRKKQLATKKQTKHQFCFFGQLASQLSSLGKFR